MLPFLGPAFVAAVAYVDPGNFATNIAAGSQFGYLLLWVILVSNLMAMLIQTMSAKLGIATGMNLPEVCRARFSRRSRAGLWVQAEVIAMATDLAEFIGAALGFNLLFGIPLFWAGVLTGVFSFLILALQSRGARPLEIAITVLVGVILVGFAVQFVLSDPDAAGIAHGLCVPRLRRHRERAAGHRDPGRHGDAARHLPALGADPAAGGGPHRGGAAGASSASSGSTWSSR